MQELYIQDILYTMGWDNLEYIRVGWVVSMQELYIQDILYTIEFDNLEYIGVGLNGFISEVDKNNYYKLTLNIKNMK